MNTRGLDVLLLSRRTRPLSVETLFGRLRRGERVHVRPELDDFAEQVVGLALPVGDGAVVVGVARGVLIIDTLVSQPLP